MFSLLSNNNNNEKIDAMSCSTKVRMQTTSIAKLKTKSDSIPCSSDVFKCGERERERERERESIGMIESWDEWEQVSAQRG